MQTSAKITYLVDDDVPPLRDVNAVSQVAPPSLEAATFDHVRVVAFSTTYDLDFQQCEGNHCTPVN